jgi:hypothetical protein
MLHIAEAMGFLALLIRQAPTEIAEERQRFQTMVDQTVAAQQAVQTATLSHQQQLDRRFKDLPGQIAQGINPAAIAGLLSEMLRQQIQETGLAAASEAIAVQVQTLRQTSKDFALALHQFTDPENGAIRRVHDGVSCMRAELDCAANHVRALIDALTKDLRRALAILCAGALAIGFILGIFYIHWINLR